MNPQIAPAAAPMLILGLPPLAWAAIAGIVLVGFLIYRVWSTGADRQAVVALKAARKRRLADHVALTNEALNWPQPVEPAPLDYVREGSRIPKPRSNAALAAELDAIKAAGGATVPLASSGDTSKTPTLAGTGTASAPSASTNVADMLAAALKTPPAK